MNKNAINPVAMKHRSTLLLTMALTALLTSVGLTAVSLRSTLQKPEANLPQTVNPLIGNLTLVLECSLPEVPTTVPRLKVTEPTIDEETARVIAEKVFGLSVDSDLHGSFSFLDKHNGKTLYLSGMSSLLYFDDSHRRSGAIPSLPSAEEAVSIAYNFLEKLRKLFPKPEDAQIILGEVFEAEISILSLPDGTEIGKIVYSIGVSFRQELYGIRLWGPGADLSIWVANGKVVNAEIRQKWTHVDGYIEIILAPEEALKKLLRWETFGPQPLVGPLPTEGEIRIKSMELVYYADLPSMQSYLTPCYRITCEVVGLLEGEPHQVSFTALISAI